MTIFDVNRIYEKRGDTLDTDEVMLQFDELEQKVETLIERCRLLEATHSELQIKIEGLESELQKKDETVNHYTQQKAHIRSKIDKLLARLNGTPE